MKCSVPASALVVVVWLSGATVTSQEAPNRQVFKSRVDLVTTDVNVRDSRGRFVADLKADEFEVREDGVTQQIVSLVRVQGGRVYNDRLPAAAPPREGVLVPSRPAGAEEGGRIFIIFIDDQHLSAPDTPHVRHVLRQVAKMLIRDGDMFAVVSTGPSSIAIDMTYDRRRLDAAIEQVMGSGLSPTEILEAQSGREGPAEVRHRAHVAFQTAYDMLRQLEQVPHRRKAFIYVSNGYDFNPFGDTRAKQDADRLARMARDADVARDPFAQAAGAFAEADLVAELAEVTRAANRANASIYAIDPRGLVAGPDISQRVDTIEWQKHVTAGQNSLRVLSDLTGGFAIVNSNDFERGLKRIDLETSDYYVLGYYSSNPDSSRRRRRIEITVRRKGVEVRGRTEYALPPLR